MACAQRGQTLTANFVQIRHKYGKMKKLKEVNKIWQHIRAYLRQRILSAWENKENTQRGLAQRFKVSLSFIRDLLRRYRETNEIAAKPQG